VWVVVAAALSAQGESMPRLRSSHPYIRAMVAEAQVRSATFRRLVDAIEATNGIVYIEDARCRHGVNACLPIAVTSAGGYRFMRVLVDATRQDWDVMSSIGHELQHAVEVLSQPGIQTGEQAFFEFYRSGKSGEPETAEARRAGLAVRHEIEVFSRNGALGGMSR
jgi:hypothetical protein